MFNDLPFRLPEYMIIELGKYIYILSEEDSLNIKRFKTKKYAKLNISSNDELDNLVIVKSIDDEDIKIYFKNKDINRTVFLSEKDLYEYLLKLSNGENTKEKEVKNKDNEEYNKLITQKSKLAILLGNKQNTLKQLEKNSKNYMEKIIKHDSQYFNKFLNYSNKINSLEKQLDKLKLEKKEVLKGEKDKCKEYNKSYLATRESINSLENDIKDIKSKMAELQKNIDSYSKG